MPLGAITKVTTGRCADPHQPHGPVPGDHRLVQPGARRLAGRGGHRHPEGARRNCRRRRRCRRPSRAPPRPSSSSLTNEALLILGALVTVYIVLGVLYESYIHPITILSTLPVGGRRARSLALLVCRDRADGGRDHRHRAADRHRAEERHHDDRLRARRASASEQQDAPIDAIHQACLLRFRPILMTTMAAMLGAVPLALRAGRGLRAAPPARHHDHRRPDLQPAADALHDAGHLPLLRRAGGQARGPRRARAIRSRPARRRRRRPLPSHEPVRRRSSSGPIATTLLTVAVALSGVVAFRVLPVSPLPQVDFPTDLGLGLAARGKPRDHGLLGGDAPRARIRPDRRRDRDDLAEHARPDEHHAAVRPQPQHRRRGARRRGGDQCGAQLPAVESSEQSRPTGR